MDSIQFAYHKQAPTPPLPSVCPSVCLALRVQTVCSQIYSKRTHKRRRRMRKRNRQSAFLSSPLFANLISTGRKATEVKEETCCWQQQKMEKIKRAQSAYNTNHWAILNNPQSRDPAPKPNNQRKRDDRKGKSVRVCRQSSEANYIEMERGKGDSVREDKGWRERKRTSEDNRQQQKMIIRRQ